MVYIDCEDDEARIVGRLLAMGADREALRAWFSYRRPFGAWTEDDVTELVRWITDHAVALVVLDGATDALALHGLSSNLDTDIAVLFSTFGGRLAAAGPAVVFIDHVTNEGAESGLATRARGSGHKIGALSGTALFVDGEATMGRGLAGHSHVSIGRKVRGGWLQEHTVAGTGQGKRRVALLEVDAIGEGVTVRLGPPLAVLGGKDRKQFQAAAKDTEIVASVLALWEGEEAGEVRSKNWIDTELRRRGGTAARAAVLRMVDWMTDEGLLTKVEGGWVAGTS